MSSSPTHRRFLVSHLARSVVCVATLGLTWACSTTPEASPGNGDGQGGTHEPDASNVTDVPDAATPPDGAVPASDWSLGSPFATDQPAFTSATHPLQPTALFGAMKAPFPTNSVWTDFTMATGVQRVSVLPYEVKALATGLQVSRPTATGTDKYVLSVFNEDVSFESVEALTGHTLTAMDSLSTTIEWTSAAGGLRVPIVRGMPYVSATYATLTPKISTVHAIVQVNGQAPGQVTGDRFVLALNNGQTWILYATSSLTVTASGSTITASAPFSGTLRLAEAPNAGAIPILDAHRGAVPVGAELTAEITGELASVHFGWKKEGTGPLLMAALPHHKDQLSEGTILPIGGDGGSSIPTLRGAMSLVEGDRWTLHQPLPAIAWSAPRPVPADKLAIVKQAITADATTLPAATDPYFYGKQIARLGRLALMADELGDTATAQSIRASMKTSIDPWLLGTNGDALKYDSTWGGLCSTAGLSGASADFGNGWYNDHHFHYGYFLYAAAALGKGDPTWLATRKSAIYALARDIANPSKADPYFTTFRHKDWFEGHSWAAGIFEFADGRNQESSSEAVNAYYGLQLLGLAANDPNMVNVGRLLLATEITSVQKYWHITTSGTIYPASFAANKVVGVLWGTKVDYATFFGGNVEFIHGIQMMPFTPISEALLERTWVQEEASVVAPAMTSADQGWRGILTMEHAIVDREGAWTEAQALTSFDDGNSRANTLYWIATRPTPP